MKHKKWEYPELHIVNIGFNDASLSYIKKKIDLASTVGIRFKLHQFIEKNTPETKLNKDFKKIMETSKA